MNVPLLNTGIFQLCGLSRRIKCHKVFESSLGLILPRLCSLVKILIKDLFEIFCFSFDGILLLFVRTPLVLLCSHFMKLLCFFRNAGYRAKLIVVGFGSFNKTSLQISDRCSLANDLNLYSF